MGGSERFWVGEYDGSSGLSEKMVFWLKFGNKGGEFVFVLISSDQYVDRRW